MSDLKKYKTVAHVGKAEIIEKKSRFIATVAPVETPDQAVELLATVKKEHSEASHNIYAYRAGLEYETCRYSDDGEPSGTAGLPVLGLINSEDLRNIIIIVTRYFGGTLLGTGGLVRAYTHCAKQGLSNAQIIEKSLYTILKISVDYSLSGKIQYEAGKNGHYIQNTVYTSDVEFTVLVDKDKTEEFIRAVQDITNAKARIIAERVVFGTKADGEVIDYKNYSGSFC